MQAGKAPKRILMGKTTLQFSIFLLWILLPVTGMACPVCNTETGVQVRQAIFGKNFIRYTACTLAPVPLLLGGVAAIYFGCPAKGSKKKERL
jgi:hypothetical protein